MYEQTFILWINTKFDNKRKFFLKCNNAQSNFIDIQIFENGTVYGILVCVYNLTNQIPGPSHFYYCSSYVSLLKRIPYCLGNAFGQLIIKKKL